MSWLKKKQNIRTDENSLKLIIGKKMPKTFVSKRMIF